MTRAARLARRGLSPDGFPLRLPAPTPPPEPLPVPEVAQQRAPKAAPVARLWKKKRGTFGCGRPSRPGIRHRKRIERGLARLEERAVYGRPFSCAEIAAECGVSHDTIARIEAVALRKLRLHHPEILKALHHE